MFKQEDRLESAARLAKRLATDRADMQKFAILDSILGKHMGETRMAGTKWETWTSTAPAASGAGLSQAHLPALRPLHLHTCTGGTRPLQWVPTSVAWEPATKPRRRPGYSLPQGCWGAHLWDSLSPGGGKFG